VLAIIEGKAAALPQSAVEDVTDDEHDGAAPRGVSPPRENARLAADEDTALILLFSLVASGQIKLRRIDGWRKIASVLSQHAAVAA